MAIRIRKNGKILCAAMNPERKGDIYINDGLHYYLSQEVKVLVTESWKQHKKHKGEWWWITQVPKNKQIEIK